MPRSWTSIVTRWLGTWAASKAKTWIWFRGFFGASPAGRASLEAAVVALNFSSAHADLKVGATFCRAPTGTSAVGTPPPQNANPEAAVVALDFSSADADLKVGATFCRAPTRASAVGSDLGTPVVPIGLLTPETPPPENADPARRIGAPFCRAQANGAMASPIANKKETSILRNLMATSRGCRGVRKTYGTIIPSTGRSQLPCH
jgi:hypothetical protein